ncbi:MAG: preprotein translocase subunit SecY [Planctomycetota bacterium]
MLKSIQNIIRIPELRKKLLYTFGFLCLYRLGRYITLPGVDTQVIENLMQQKGAQGGLGSMLQFASMITGGALRQCTLFALGIMPYISASIIFSLLVKVIPQLEALQKEGPSGQQKINQYTRYSTVLLCLIQSAFIVAWMRQPLGGQYIVPPELSAQLSFWFMTVLALTTGTIFLMWIGEQITEFGIGNGISLIIMVGIIAEMPGALYQFGQDIAASGMLKPLATLKFLTFIVLYIAIIVCVVVMQRGQRRIPIQQAKHTRGRRVYGGQRHYLPLLVNAAGVMPVIFAQSLIILPSALASAVGITFLHDYLSRGDGFWYLTVEMSMVIFFTYFWNALTFNPVEMANNMKEYGSFIPGIRPGKRTADYLEEIMNRITLVGALFLAALTTFPVIVSSTLDIQQNIAGFLGGTGILIVVGVALDVVQKVESHLLMRHYEGFMKTGRIRGRKG